jgi:hypothetical protein
VILVDGKRNCQPPFESHDSKAATDVVAQYTAFRGKVKSSAVCFDSLDVSERSWRVGRFRDPFVEFEQIRARFRRKDDLSTLQVRSLSVASW